MKFLQCFGAVVLAVVLVGCQVDNAGVVAEVESVNPWTNLNFNNNPDNFQFAITSDLTGGYREGVFDNAVRKINLLGPEFVITVGDLIQGYTEDEAELNRQWDKFDGMVKQLNMSFFYVPGNHDMANSAMLKVWRQRYGRTYYHFVYKNVLFMCVNTDDPPQDLANEEAGKAENVYQGQISDRQVDYFRKVLRKNQDVRWTCVFQHKPLWTKESSEFEVLAKIENLLQDRNYTYFAGHQHQYVKTMRHGQKYICLATTGGINGGLTPKHISQKMFDHFMWVTMTDNGPVIANVLLNGVLDEDLTKAAEISATK